MFDGIGTRLKEIRNKYNITQADLGIKTDYSLKTISRYELEETTPDTQFLYKLYQFYQINPIWLLCGRGNMILYSVNEMELMKTVHDDGEIQDIIKKIGDNKVLKAILHTLLMESPNDEQLVKQIELLKTIIRN